MRTAFQVPNALAPSDGVGPLYLPIPLDFSVVSIIDIDLFEEQTNAVFDKAQSVYVDNKTNANPLVLHFAGTDYELSVPAFAGGIFPVFTNGTCQCRVSTTPGADVLPQIAFVNVPMPLTQWGPFTVNIANVTASATPVAATAADHSSAIAVGGTSQALFAANPNALRRIVYNPSANAESLLINFGGVAASAADSLEIMPGGSFDTGIGPVDQTAWTINNASVNAMPYVAKEFV